MDTDDASPFIRGIQNRLDAIFGEDKKKPVHGEGADPLKEAAAESMSAGVRKENGTKDPKVISAKGPDKTPFIRGIENRLDAIFGEYEKQPDHKEGADTLKAITADTGIPDVLKGDGKKDLSISGGGGVTEEIAVDRKKEDSVKIVGDKGMSEHTKKSDIRDLSERKSLRESAMETRLSGDKDDKTERFEQLFGELVTSSSIMYSPLKDLKSMVLSIEWEVTEQGMEKFDTEVNKLSDAFVEDKIILGFLKILRFLGMYIRVKGVDTHYGAVKLLMSVYDNLEQALLTKDISDAQKHELLCEEVKKYRDWVQTVDLAVKEDEAEREETRIRKESAVASKKHIELPMGQAVRAAKESELLGGGVEMTPHEAFAFALEEIKKVISAEFSALRAELKLWRQDK